MATGTMLYITSFMTYVGWWLIPLVVIFAYRKRLQKYPIEATIYEKRGKALVKTNDMLGRFDSPVNCYKFKATKGDSIPIPEYDWVLQSMYKPTNLLEKISNLLVGRIGAITLFKYSSKQYKPIKVQMNGQLTERLQEVRGVDGQPVYITVYEPVNPVASLSKLDFQVIDWDDINHMTQELRAIAVRRSPIQDFIGKWWPMIAVVLGVFALIIAGYYYKEMMMDAGSKYASLTNPNKPGQIVQGQEIAKASNIPLIGDLVTPQPAT